MGRPAKDIITHKPVIFLFGGEKSIFSFLHLDHIDFYLLMFHPVSVEILKNKYQQLLILTYFSSFLNF